MELCITLLDDFKKSTIKDLSKKGYNVVDSEGNVIKNIDTIVDNISQSSRKDRKRPEDSYTCKARIWNEGYGDRCSKIKLPNSDVCAQHKLIEEKYGKLVYGITNQKRETEFPYGFRRQSEKKIPWKGTDKKAKASVKLSKSVKSVKSVKARKSSSIKRSTAAKKIQARYRGRQARKTQKKEKTQKKKSRKSSSIKRSAAAKKIQAIERGRQARKTQKKTKKTKRSGSSSSSSPRLFKIKSSA